MSILRPRCPNEGKFIKICYKIRENFKLIASARILSNKDILVSEIDTVVREIDQLGRDLTLFNPINWGVKSKNYKFSR